MYPKVKPYNTIHGCCPYDEVVTEDEQMVICCGPAEITIDMPAKMTVAIGLVWKNSLGYDEALLIDADMKDLMTINDEYILVPTR